MLRKLLLLFVHQFCPAHQKLSLKKDNVWGNVRCIVFAWVEHIHVQWWISMAKMFDQGNMILSFWRCSCAIFNKKTLTSWKLRKKGDSVLFHASWNRLQWHSISFSDSLSSINIYTIKIRICWFVEKKMMSFEQFRFISLDHLWAYQDDIFLTKPFDICQKSSKNENLNNTHRKLWKLCDVNLFLSFNRRSWVSPLALIFRKL